MTDQPFRIALVGDFGARAGRVAPESGRALAARRPLRVDRDSVDDAIARVAPQLELEVAGAGHAVHVVPRSLDDFHPDRLAALPFFESLRATRELPPAEPVAAPPKRPSAPTPMPMHGAADAGETLGLLERIVGEALPYSPDPAPPRTPAGDAELDALLRRLVAPHLVQEPSARERAWQAAVDRAVEQSMRQLLRAPDFQALEARWRAVHFLARRLDTDATLQIHLLDVTPEELAADLASDDDAAIGASGIARLLGESAAAPFALVVGLFALGTSDEDAALAARLARVARLTGAPWVVDAHHALAGAPAPLADCPDPDDWTVELPAAWRATRRSPDASWLALVTPRVLARPPYGKHGEPCERLPFEELEPEDERPAPASHFLWGSAAVLAALLVGEAFAEDGWSLRPRNDVRGLPLFVRRVAGEPTILPCAEMPMTERAALRLLERGLVPAAWVRDDDTVRLVRLQSIADPPAPLSARWRAGA